MMNFKKIFGLSAFAAVMLGSCAQGGNEVKTESDDNGKNVVIETIMSRRSVRDYEQRAIPRDTMQLIAECGINAPNGMNKQDWEIKIVDDPEFIKGITEL